MIPCPTCFTPFAGLNDLLAHANGGDSVNFRPGYFCLWIDCNSGSDGFYTLGDFLAHVEFHLSSTTCLWIGCPAPKNLNRAHLLLHVFAIICRNDGVYALQIRIDLLHRCLKQCKNIALASTCHPARSNWILDHLRCPDYDGLYCQWMNCRLKFENPIDFFNHVMSHAGKTAGRFKTCQWSGCTAEASRIDSHLRELHTIPRFLCPFCLVATYSKKYELISHIEARLARKRKSKMRYKRNLVDVKRPRQLVPLLSRMEPPSLDSSASAPDLEDIIGDSDEENQELFGLLGQQRGPEATESVTLPELIKRFKKIWQNEKLSPELMTVQTDVVSLIARELNAFEQQITAQPRGELKTQLMRLQAERLRYLITDYLRVRIKKIEQYYHYVIMEERARPQSEEPHLSPAEFNFAKTLDNAILNNLRSVVLNNLPVNMRKIDPDAIAIRPNLDSYVFCQIKSRVEIAEPGIEQRASNLSTNMLTLLPGEIHLLPYRAIRQQTEDGAVILL
ncbi:hypothetical protein Aperf_G00000120766 [Anoplocephala perfoliata]